MSERIKLWLDDVRDPNEHGAIGFTWVKTAAEAIEMLKAGNVHLASLDHDLAEEHYPWNCPELPPKGAKTGYDVVCWMEENDVWPPGGVRVHSQNPAGAHRMWLAINRHYNGPVW